MCVRARGNSTNIRTTTDAQSQIGDCVQNMQKETRRRQETKRGASEWGERIELYMAMDGTMKGSGKMNATIK